MNEETKLPDGLQLAVKLLAQIGNDDSDRAIAAVHAVMDHGQPGELPDGLNIAVEMIGEYAESGTCCSRRPAVAIDAIRAEHAQRVTMQHHACDLAQRVADLESIVNAPRGTDAQIMKEREIAAAAIDGALAFGYQGTEAPEAWHWLLAAHNAGKRIAELEAERNTARGAVRELERQVFALQQQRDVLQTCLDRHQRDAGDPPGYLQDAVIRAAGLGALHEERDAAIKERDALRDLIAAAIADAKREGSEQMRAKMTRKMQAQKPVAWVRYRGDGGIEGPLLDAQVEEVRRHCWTPLVAADWADRSMPTGPRQAVVLCTAEVGQRMRTGEIK